MYDPHIRIRMCEWAGMFLVPSLVPGSIPGTNIMRTVLLFLASALLAPCAVAQSLPPGEKETAYIMVNDSLVGGLVLDTLQRRQLAAVEQRYQKNYDAILKNDTLGDAAMRLSLDNLTAQRNAAIKNVMTAEQYAQWERITGAEQGERKAH